MTRWLFWSLLLVTIVSLTQAKELQTPQASPNAEDQSSTKTENTASPSQEKVTDTLTEPEEIEAIEKGQKLHQLHCVTCHDSNVYTREDRMIKDYDSLKTQVQRCATHLNKMWFEEEVMDVATYLNATYYSFEIEKVTE